MYDLDDRALRNRRSLLATSLAGLLISLAGTDVENVVFLGVTIGRIGRDPILLLTALLLWYFAVSYYVTSYAARQGWKKRVLDFQAKRAEILEETQALKFGLGTLYHRVMEGKSEIVEELPEPWKSQRMMVPGEDELAEQAQEEWQEHIDRYGHPPPTRRVVKSASQIKEEYEAGRRRNVPLFSRLTLKISRLVLPKPKSSYRSRVRQVLSGGERVKAWLDLYFPFVAATIVLLLLVLSRFLDFPAVARAIGQ